MLDIIKVSVRNVYGNETVYPVCPQAKLLSQLAGTKTLTPEALRTISDLGYSIEIENTSTALLRQIAGVQS